MTVSISPCEHSTVTVPDRCHAPGNANPIPSQRPRDRSVVIDRCVIAVDADAVMAAVFHTCWRQGGFQKRGARVSRLTLWWGNEPLPDRQKGFRTSPSGELRGRWKAPPVRPEICQGWPQSVPSRPGGSGSRGDQKPTRPDLSFGKADPVWCSPRPLASRGRGRTQTPSPQIVTVWPLLVGSRPEDRGSRSCRTTKGA